MTSSIPPAFVLLLGALVVPFLKGHVRNAWMLLLPVAGFANLFFVPAGTWGQYSFFGYADLTAVRVDDLSLVFGYIFHIAAFLGVLYALHIKDRLQQVSALIYAGSAVGAVFAGDLITLFLFWEVVGVSSVFLILARRTKESYNSAFRYILWQLFSGVLLLIGAALHIQANPDTGVTFGAMTEALMAGQAGALLIFLAFGVKCGWPLFHVWFVDAYPNATVTGTVFLSTFTTKLAVYALLRGFPGAEPLIWIGLAMSLFPIFYAVIENDLRRVLCYSMVNQIGFMVVGIGLGTPLALDGAAAHAFCDILFKGLLFMAMGAVLLRTGSAKGTDLGGLYRSMPWTARFCLVGAASISAFPFFSAFISKSLIMIAAADQGYDFVWLCLLFASAGVLEHAGIKIPFFSFFAHDSGLRPKEAPWNMLGAMGIASVLCIALGVFPDVLYSILPHRAAGMTFSDMYSMTHIVTQLQLLLMAALAVFWMMRSGIYPPEIRAINLDAEWFTRTGARAFYRFVAGPLMGIFAWLSKTAHETIPGALRHFALNPAGAMQLAYDRFVLGFAGGFRSMASIDRAQGRLRSDQGRYEKAAPGANWSIGTSVLYAAIAFLVFLLFYLTA